MVRAALLVAAILAAAFGLVWACSSDAHVAQAFAVVLAVDGSLAALWIVAAIGYGLLAVRALGLTASLTRFEFLWLGAATGVALLAAADNALATLGWLGGLSVILPVGGVAALLLALRRGDRRFGWPGSIRAEPLHDEPNGYRSTLPLLVLPIATLLAAAASAPGWLWPTEFGGYDALSYHLQLPREWLLHGRATPLAHNVYSFLPSWMETAFLHLMLLRSGGTDTTGAAWGAAVASQFLAAGTTIVAAGATGAAAMQFLGRTSAGLSRAIFLAIPWVIVTGSMAYTEPGVLAGCAGALAWCLIATRFPHVAPRAALLAGICMALAIGSKLSSGPLVAIPMVPVAAAVVWRLPWRRRLAVAALGLGAVVVPLLPWLLRNWEAMGNPLFPFATSAFGPGPGSLGITWSADECARFAQGHTALVSPWGHVQLLWDQWIRFGIGAPPDADPWLPQWGPLPWLAILGAAGCLTPAIRRRWPLLPLLVAVLALQVLCWLTLTHMKSRFLLPTAVPCAILAAALVGWILAATAGRRTIGSFAARGGLLLLSTLPAMLLLGLHAGGAPRGSVPLPGPLDFIGAERVATGEALAAMMRESDAPSHEWRATAAASGAPFAVNGMLPLRMRTLLIGEAAPFWIRGPFEYATVWDGAGLLPHGAEQLPDPEAWADGLASRGIGAVYVDDAMLRRWRSDGWLAPQLTPEAVERLLGTLEPECPTRNGRLFRVPGVPAGEAR